MRYLPTTLAAVTLIVADFGLAAEPDAWTVYLAARERAGGAIPGRLADYSYDVVTTLPAGEDQVDVHGSVVVILPDLIRQELQTPQGVTQLVFDGVSAWQVIIGAKRRDLPNEAAALQRAELERRHILHGALPAKELVRYRREELVDDRIADVIEIIDVGGAPLRLYVDRQNKDVVKYVYVGDIPGGGMAQVEEEQSDFVDIDGFRFATRRTVVRNGKPARTSALSGIRVNSGVKREIILR